ncbi:MAG: radical SAM protein [Gammaproteobacteria bacterium]|nr:radical SAM protein [Gammaproteobacteria bacterium]
MSNKLVFPVPKPDKQRYDQMLEDGFKHYPKRKKNWLKYQQSEKTTILDYLPVKADIENISRCNFRCSHCLVSTFENQKRARDLTPDEFKNFIDEQIGLVEIKMQGLGEPFMQRAFVDMVKYATDRYIWVRTTTNGSILHRRDNYKRIIDANVGEIQVSIDGASKQTQEQIRLDSDFNQIIKNCQLLNGYCDDMGRDDTRMWSVLQESNIDEAEDFLYLAKNAGFKRLTLSMELREWDGHDQLNNNIKNNRVSQIITQQWIDHLLAKAKEIDLNLSFWHATDRFNQNNICFWPFERILLSSEAEIVPCCIIADPALFNFGAYSNFNEIWNGKKMQAFRNAHIEGKLPDICKVCYD